MWNGEFICVDLRHLRLLWGGWWIHHPPSSTLLLPLIADPVPDALFETGNSAGAPEGARWCVGEPRLT
jgi:hypothetical protein